jgi:hypothetical protein
MRLYAVVCKISIAIYRFASYSCVAIHLKNVDGRCKLIDMMSVKGKYSNLTNAVALFRSDVTGA